MSKASKVAGSFLSDLAARAFQDVATKVVDEGVSRVGRFAGNLRDKVRDETYERYTDPIEQKVNIPKGEARPRGTKYDEKLKRDVGDDPRQVSQFYKGGVRQDPLRPEVGGENPFNRPTYDSDTKTWSARGTHTPDPENWREQGQSVFYANPEVTAQAAGYGALAAAAGTTLAAGSWVFGDRRKPQSDYRVPVQPSKQQGGYNPSVESALASASSKYELQEQKHAHDMELQRFRMEAKTPGKQDKYDYPNLSSSGGSLDDVWSSPSLF